MVTDPGSGGRNFCDCLLRATPALALVLALAFALALGRGRLPQQDLDPPGTDQIREPADACESQPTVETQGGEVLPVGGGVEPAPLGEGARRDAVDEAPPHPLPARLGADRQQSDEGA